MPNLTFDLIREELMAGSFDYQSKFCPHGMQGRHERCVSCLTHYAATGIKTERDLLVVAEQKTQEAKEAFDRQEPVIRAQAENLGTLRRELNLANQRIKELTDGQ